ncbi:ninja-family protein AFP3-like [Phalaenopsis equestris]|uniref:ninja-family protein AFP3-like n=1 Tax=Phalaenopsis equestris TaxID=78828 RepID=UPI0009E38246|nr:ninja-family protein AFP3-like [Phalaenopsis equestris]
MDIKLLKQETEELSYPRDLLWRLAGAGLNNERPPMKLDIEPELSLGLSLGGCFASEPREMRLVRSSSIATLSVFPNEPASSSLVRTCSLPVEANEENRKRKEMQSLKRLEAKRKRTERRSSWRPPMVFTGSGDPKEEPSRAMALRKDSSDFDGGALEESDLSSLSNSSAVTSLPDTAHKSVATDSIPQRLRSLNSLQGDDIALKRMTDNINRPQDMGRNMMDEMPCVSVKGDGLNGRRIEGFLYKYRKGEEVRIVCVCHGSFLTPAEFVKHAGGGNVTHPLRHIVVNPSPSIYY